MKKKRYLKLIAGLMCFKNVQPISHVQYSSVDHVDHAAPRAPRWWTTVRPRKGTTRSRGRRDSGCPRGEEYEGSLIRLRCEAAVAAE